MYDLKQQGYVSIGFTFALEVSGVYKSVLYDDRLEGSVWKYGNGYPGLASDDS
jgi:hypothetical protein